MRSSLFLCVLCACSSSSAVDAGASRSGPGPFAVGSRHLTVPAADGGRVLPVELWYPASGARTTTFPVEDFEPEPRRAQLSEWVAQAPERCTPRAAHSMRDAPVVGSNLPLLVFSHCTDCFRFSLHSVAERLASHGVVVAAPDVTNTGFDAQAPLTDAFLSVRAGDVSAVIDVLTSAGSPVGIDPRRLAVFGHSFGAVTTAKVVETDARVKAGFLIAAPADSPFLNSGALSRVSKPLSYLLAVEDNSIGFFGNEFIRDNFRKTPKPSWLIEVENAGHYSFTDIAMLGGRYQPGCGEGTREVDGGTFSYLDNDAARDLTRRAVTAWALAMLDDDAAAAEALSALASSDVRVRRR